MKALPDPRPRRYRLWQADKPLLSKFDRWRKMAELLKLSKRARQKLGWFIYHEAEASGNARLTCRHFGIGKTAFYRWLAVFDPSNLRALEEGSRAPVHTREHVVLPLVEERIVGLRKASPEFGKMKIQALYQRLFSEPVSSWQVQLVIEKHRLQRKPAKATWGFRKQSISKRKTVSLKREQRAGFLVAFDSIELQRNGIKRYVVTGIDTVTKVAWARMYTSHSSATARDLFIRLYAVVHGNVLNTCQDNGSEFEAEFAAQLAALDIPQYFSRVRTPKDNPVCERFNRTLKEEFLRMGNWTPDVQDFNRRLSAWLLKYNCVRPHQSLGYKTPFEYAFNQPALVRDVSI
jgi:transposase InsO family protein